MIKWLLLVGGGLLVVLVIGLFVGGGERFVGVVKPGFSDVSGVKVGSHVVGLRVVDNVSSSVEGGGVVGGVVTVSPSYQVLLLSSEGVNVFDTNGTIVVSNGSVQFFDVNNSFVELNVEGFVFKSFGDVVLDRFVFARSVASVLGVNGSVSGVSVSVGDGFFDGVRVSGDFVDVVVFFDGFTPVGYSVVFTGDVLSGVESLASSISGGFVKSSYCDDGGACFVSVVNDVVVSDFRFVVREGNLVSVERVDYLSDYSEESLRVFLSNFADRVNFSFSSVSCSDNHYLLSGLVCSTDTGLSCGQDSEEGLLCWVEG